jgi:hypothetical protein
MEDNMTLDELIEEGNTFEVKRTEPNMYYQNGFNVIEKPVSYIENGDKYLLWIENCKRFLVTNYPDDIAYENFEKASADSPASNADIYKSVAILKSLKSIPTACIRKDKETTSSDKLVLNISQSQNINIDVVLRTLKEEIGKSGIQSLKDVQGKSEEEKKQNIISKLKSFGENTLSNIIANILTNPSVWSQL